MKLKSKLFIIILFLLCFTLNITVNAKIYNVPKYDENTENPGGGEGFSAPSTKFDIFNTDDTDETNYALTKLINIQPNESKTFVLDFFTIEWYGSYPTQEVVVETSDNEILDFSYFKDNVEAGTSSVVDKTKNITDSTLPERILGSKLNSDFPTLTIKLDGLKEGLTKLKITINSNYQYGIRDTSEYIELLVNVSSNAIVSIPNYIDIHLGSGIHSGAKNVRYDNNEFIGILKEEVRAFTVNIPEEIATYNETAVNKVFYRILTDSSISVAGDVLSFNNPGLLSTFTIEYYMVCSTSEEIEIASYSFTCVFYSISDVSILYDGRLYKEATEFEIGKSIKAQVTNELKPYLEHLLIVYTGDYNLTLLPYQNDDLYVFTELDSEVSIKIGDKLLSQCGLNAYSGIESFATLNLSPMNVVEKKYPSLIDLDNEYYYDVENSLSEIIEIKNIQEFSASTKFQITTDGDLAVAVTEDFKIKLDFSSETNIQYAMTNYVHIEAQLDNGTTLVKDFIIKLLPMDGYKYTFNTLKINLLVGETKTIILGISNPGFDEVTGDVIATYYVKNGNIIVNVNREKTSRYDIVGYKVGSDSAYFIINDQMIEVTVEVTQKSTGHTVNFTFAQGSTISAFAKNDIILTVPSAFAFLDFKYIIFDDSILQIESIKDGNVKIKGLKDGTTQVFLYAQSEENFYNGFITIKIITEVPSVYIIYDKEDNLTAFTKFDDINVSFDANEFDFSKSTTYTWYLNNKLIYQNKKNFTQKFGEGINTLRLVINDQENNIFLETTQEINISAVINETKTIAINCDKVIYVDKKQGSFEIEVLLDGVLNPSYKYLWSISNTGICKIDINGNERIVIDPLNSGETDLTVMTNISKYEEIFIKADIRIIVCDATYTIENDNFIKPGTTQRFKLLGNDTKIYNWHGNVTMTCNNEAFNDFEIEDNEIVVKNMPRGTVSIKVDYNGEKIEKSFEVTNFNIKEIVSLILPYLIIVCILVLGISFAVAKRKGKIERAGNKIIHLESELNKAIENKNFTTSEVRHILHQTIVVKKMLTYCIDEGIDELSTIMPNVDKLIKILIATINSNVDSAKIEMILKNVKDHNVEIIIKDFKVIQDERTEFEAKKKVIDEVVKKDKKIKMTKEEYESFLVQSKYMNGDEEE